MAVWDTINYAEIRPDRFDAEFFQPIYKGNIRKLTSFGDSFQLGDLFLIIDRGEKADYIETGNIPVLRSVNIRDLSFNDQRQEYVSREYYDKKAKGQIHKGDILITSTGTGTLGRTSIWYKDTPAFNVPENSFLRSPIGVNPYFVAAFLSTQYGVLQLFQNQRGSSGQLHLYPVDIRRIIIPKFLFDYQDEIGSYLIEAFRLDEQSHSLYHQAETLLAKELQLDQLKLPNKKWYTTRYCEVVGNGRCDGEYYQPKYKQLMEHLSKFKCKALGSLCDFNKGFEIGSSSYKDHGKLFMRVSNISENGIHLGNSDKYLSDFDFHRLKLFQIEKGDVLCTKDGTIAMCYVIDEDIEGIFSSGIVKLSLNEEIPTEYLAIVINSVFGKMQANRDCSGALITHWKIGEMKKIQIPIIASTSMNTIADYVIQSKAAKRQSKQLLAQAKRRVEEMIEQEANKNK